MLKSFDTLRLSLSLVITKKELNYIFCLVHISYYNFRPVTIHARHCFWFVRQLQLSFLLTNVLLEVHIFVKLSTPNPFCLFLFLSYSLNPLLSRPLPFWTEFRGLWGLFVSTVLSMVLQLFILESCKALEDEEESVVDGIGPLLLLNFPVFNRYSQDRRTSVFIKQRKTNIRNPCKEFNTTKI